MLDCLSAAEDYHSPPTEPGWLGRHFPSLAFYRGMIGVVYQAHLKCKKGQYADTDWLQSSKAIIESLEAVGGEVHVTGTQFLDQVEGPCVVLGNHMSTLETFILPWILRSKLPLTFVIKESLLRYPVFKEVMRSRDPVVVSRTNPKEDLMVVLKEGEAKLKAGFSITIFPQTTRTLKFDAKSFNTIGVKLARRAAVPVVPVAIKTNAWRTDGWPVKEFGKIQPEETVRIEFGEPMTISGSGKAENEIAARFIEDRLKEWGMEIEETGPSED